MAYARQIKEHKRVPFAEDNGGKRNLLRIWKERVIHGKQCYTSPSVGDNARERHLLKTIQEIDILCNTWKRTQSTEEKVRVSQRHPLKTTKRTPSNRQRESVPSNWQHNKVLVCTQRNTTEWNPLKTLQQSTIHWKQQQRVPLKTTPYNISK